MNFLAHLVLAGKSVESKLGNLIADSVKGRDALDSLGPAVRRGVVMHRAIDAFTDSHPITRESRKRFSPRWKRVSGILIDVYFDHCLATQWNLYCPETLREYLNQQYLELMAGAESLPEPQRFMIKRLVAEDLMMTYSTLTGIEWALTRVSLRLRNGEFQLQESLPEFAEQLPAFQNDFLRFFKDAQAFATDWETTSNAESAEATLAVEGEIHP